MSHKVRHLNPHWGPGDPAFEALYPRTKTKSSHTAVRRARKGDVAFSKDMKHSRHNLTEKNRALSLKEHLELLDDE